MSSIKTVIIYTFYEFCVGSVTKKFACGLTNRLPYGTLAKLTSDGYISIKYKHSQYIQIAPRIPTDSIQTHKRYKTLIYI